MGSGRALRRVAGAIAFAVLIAAPGFGGGGAAHAADDGVKHTNRPVPGEYVVVLRPGVTNDVPAFAQLLARQHDGDVFETYEHALSGFAVRMTEQQADALSHNPFVESVTENGVATLVTTQSPAPSWGLDRIDEEYLPLDHEYTYNANGAGVTAYVIDTGIRTTHTDFGGRASVGVDELGGNGSDCNGHGT